MPTRHIYLSLKMLLLVLLSNTTNAQQGNVWALGYQSGLDFNFSPPKVISTSIRNAQMAYDPKADEFPAWGASSISNCKGELLFYGNCAEIFNRYHKRMPNGLLSRPTGGYTIDRLSILPVPGDTSKYFYIYTRPYGNSTLSDSGIYYCIVDMALDSGRGDVDVKSFVQVSSTQLEYFTYIKQSNNKDYWLISLLSGNKFLVQSLTANGIQSSDTQTVSFFTGYNGYLFIKPSHKGDKLLISGISNINNKYRAVLLNFNRKLGLVSTPRLFFTDNTVEGTGTLGSEFSPNDSFFYLTSRLMTSTYVTQKVWQYETYSTFLDKNRTEIYSYTWTERRAGETMQLGPDNKIYSAVAGDSFFSVIHQPNRKGKACNYKKREIDLRPTFIGAFMPNAYFPVKNLDFRITAGCTDTVRFTNLSDTSYFKSFIWYFGDGDSSSNYSPKRAYKKSGKYFVKLLGINQCGAKQWYSDTIEVWVPAKPGFKKDTVIYSCGQAVLYLSSTSKDSAQHYSYTFGDSLSADTSINPVHIYYKSGKYLLKQVVDNGYCKDSATDSVEINIETFPQADFTALQTKGCTPFNVQFSNQSTDAFRYKWLFDNKTDTAKAPTHTFTDTGFHQVILLAYNNQGCVDSIIKDSFIYVSPQPKPQFTYTTKKVCAGIETSFQSQSIFSANYIWNIDGKTDTTTNPVYTFRNNGEYKVTLTAINPYCQNIDTQKIKIILPDTVISKFDSDKKAGCPNTEITFINQSKNVVKQTWYFGDGKTSIIFSPKHTYNSAGKYTVSLVSYSAEGCKDSVTLKDYINILPYPEALFSSDSGTFTCERVTYTYNNQSNYADSFRWSFGDGSPVQITYATGSLSHTYNKNGKFKTTITAFNGYCIDTAIIMQQIDLRKPPVADFTIQDNKLCISSASAKFINKSIFADSYIWDLGDGTIDTTVNPIHTYPQPGIYNVILIVKSKEGCTHTKIWNKAVFVSNLLSAKFTADKTEGCAPLNVKLSPVSSNDTGLIYHWNFGNGKTSSENSPAIVFDYGTKDSFLVSLHITNKMCSDSFSTWIKILNLREDKDTAKLVLATVENNKAIRLNWNELKLAKNYLLQRSEDGNNFSFTKYLTGTTYLDELTDVHKKSYYYKITAIDACGGRSTMSNVVRTILLQAEVKGNDESVQLNWNKYEGFGSNTTHNLLREKSNLYSTTTENAFDDVTFFDENLLQRCYIVEAENQTKMLKSISNEVCLNYQPRIYIPNAFSPNNDGINDVFEIKTTGIISYELVVYDRWGEKIFSGTEKTKPWNGNFNNSQVIEGIYFLMLSVKDLKGNSIYKNGNINLVR